MRGEVTVMKLTVEKVRGNIGSSSWLAKAEICGDGCTISGQAFGETGDKAVEALQRVLHDAFLKATELTTRSIKP